MIEVNARDRPALLSRLARALFEAKLMVHSAHIATYGERAVDTFYITDLIGSGANMVTGDYSRGASGFWIENGELTYPVSEITIAGNLKDMFKTIRPASNLEFRSSVSAPNCLVEGLTIAGV